MCKRLQAILSFTTHGLSINMDPVYCWLSFRPQYEVDLLASALC